MKAVKLNEGEKHAICSEATSGKLKKSCYSNRYLTFVNEAVQPGDQEASANANGSSFVHSFSIIRSAADCIGAKNQILRAMAAQLKKDVEEGVLQIPEGNKGKKAKQTPKTKGLQEAHQPQELCCEIHGFAKVHANMIAARAGDFTWLEEVVRQLQSTEVLQNSHEDMPRQMHKKSLRENTSSASSWQHESSYWSAGSSFQNELQTNEESAQLFHMLQPRCDGLDLDISQCDEQQSMALVLQALDLDSDDESQSPGHKSVDGHNHAYPDCNASPENLAASTRDSPMDEDGFHHQDLDIPHTKNGFVCGHLSYQGESGSGARPPNAMAILNATRTGALSPKAMTAHHSHSIGAQNSDCDPGQSSDKSPGQAESLMQIDIDDDVLLSGAEVWEMEKVGQGQINQQSNIDQHPEHETGQEKRRPLLKKYKPHGTLISSLPQPGTATFAGDACSGIDFLDTQENGLNTDGHKSKCSPAGANDALAHDECMDIVNTQAENACSDQNATVLRKPQLGASRTRPCASREPLSSSCIPGPYGHVSASGAESPVHESPHDQRCWNHKGLLPGTIQAKPVIERKSTKSAKTKISKVPALHLVKTGDAGTMDKGAPTTEICSNIAQAIADQRMSHVHETQLQAPECVKGGTKISTRKVSFDFCKEKTTQTPAAISRRLSEFTKGVALVKPASTLRKRIPFTMAPSDKLRNTREPPFACRSLPAPFYVPHAIRQATGHTNNTPLWAQQALSSTQSLADLRFQAARYSELRNSGMLRPTDKATEKIDSLLVEVEIEVEKRILELATKGPPRPVEPDVSVPSHVDTSHVLSKCLRPAGVGVPAACAEHTIQTSELCRVQPCAFSVGFNNRSNVGHGILTGGDSPTNIASSVQHQHAAMLPSHQHASELPEGSEKCCNATTLLDDQTSIVNPAPSPRASMGATALAAVADVELCDCVEPSQSCGPISGTHTQINAHTHLAHAAQAISLVQNSCAIELDEGPAVPPQQPPWQVHSTGACQELLDWRHSRAEESSSERFGASAIIQMKSHKHTEGARGKDFYMEGFEELSNERLAALIGADSSALCDIVFDDTTSGHEENIDCVDDGNAELCGVQTSSQKLACSRVIQQVSQCKIALQPENDSLEMEFMNADDDPADHNQHALSFAETGRPCAAQDSHAHSSQIAKAAPHELMKSSTISSAEQAEPFQPSPHNATAMEIHLDCFTDARKLDKDCTRGPDVEPRVRRVVEPHLLKELMKDVLRSKGPAQSPLQELVSCLRGAILKLPRGSPHSVADLIVNARKAHLNLTGSGVVRYLSRVVSRLHAVDGDAA